MAQNATFRIGYGEDAHRLAPSRTLVIGNVRLASPLGAVAHSDGDVLLHALADALLAALALGDIGDYFPPSDPRFKDMDSANILRSVLRILQGRQEVTVVNAALVVTLDQPKLGPHRQAIQARVAHLLGLEPERVGLSFKTSEGLATGHVQARASVLLRCTPRTPPVATSKEDSMSLNIGQDAPDFTLESTLDKKVSLADFRGKKHVVLAFYPLDFSPTCSMQLPEYSASKEAFEALDAVVLGINRDSVYTHKAWAREFGIDIPLLADMTNEVARVYGVYTEGTGKNGRAVFIVDKEGKLRHRHVEAKAGDFTLHAESILERLRAL